MAGRLQRRLITACLAACLMLLAACGTFQKNPPLARYDKDAGYRFEQLDQGNNSDELFIILAFSGGGTRAAALSYGVMEALRDTKIESPVGKTTLLNEVDVISSISGGSFPAAYYGLYRDKIFEEFPERFLYRPIQSELLRQALMPANMVKMMGPSYGRSDLAAEFYDREIFGAGTYAQLIAKRTRPFVILNATDMTLGSQFSFIQDQFDLLCSDLAGVPLARAVASSSAFPGGLTPLTFQNYAGSCNYQQPPWVALAMEDRLSRPNAPRTQRAENRVSYTQPPPARPFIHLMDGGVADNLGLRGPLAAISSLDSPWSVMRMINLHKIKKLVVIEVNAATNPVTDRDQTADVPGLIDTISTAATVPLGNYTLDTLQLLKRAVDDFNREAKLAAGCKALAAQQQPQCTINVELPPQIDFYLVEVAFEYVQSAEERNWFKNLPTSLELPRETVDKLRAVGRRLLGEDKEFVRLLRAVNG